MSLAIVNSRANSGITAPAVSVEVHISNGLPGMAIVGLPEAAVKESKHRVRSALLNTHFEFPTQRITINLAPADLPKEGGRFDLPIALGILAASRQIPLQALAHYEFAGELALSGALRPIKAMLPFAIATRDVKRQLIIPQENAEEACLLQHLNVYPAQHLLEVCAHLLKKAQLQLYRPMVELHSPPILADLAEVNGQLQAKRCLEIAAAGRHSLLMIGSPGTGKTMLATRLPGILPLMTEMEALEVAAIKSISSKLLDIQNWRVRPFSAPHHTASSVALVGGGNPPQPGEISLAHNGVLFLDELPEFNRQVLEALREPLESGHVTISRASHQAQFPAKFQLITAMNPCPCGYWGDKKNECRCSPEQIRRYQSRLSGPLLDRIDMHIEVSRQAPSFFTTELPSAETSAIIRARVEAARVVQLTRHNKLNAELSGKEVEKFCQLNNATCKLFNQAIEQFNLSARSYHRVLRVARTIADLANSPTVTSEHLSEAIHYRVFDKMKLH